MCAERGGEGARVVAGPDWAKGQKLPAALFFSYSFSFSISVFSTTLDLRFQIDSNQFVNICESSS